MLNKSYYINLIYLQDINIEVKSFIVDVNKEDISTVKTIANDKCSDNIYVKKNNQTLKTEKKQKKNNPGVRNNTFIDLKCTLFILNYKYERIIKLLIY